MSKHKNVIELNGKLYDSVSGKVVGEPGHSSHGPTVVKPQPTGKNLDGFVSKPAKPSHQKHAVHVAVAHTAPTPKAHKPSRASGKHIAAHSRHQSKTLHRAGLKKPAKHIFEQEEQPSHEYPEHSATRLARAKTTPKSPRISKFGTTSAHHDGFAKKTAPLHVKKSPAEKHGHSKPSPIQHPASPILNHNQVLKEQLVSQAIKDARVDEPTHKKAKKHRVANKIGLSPKIIHFGVGTFAAVLLIGFIAYQNAPNISMKIASSKAGFSAQLPGYKPAGFGMSGPIEYGPGQITLNFKSSSDGRNFHITQKASNWNSEALLRNFVSTNNKSYQTYQENGQTIYIYDGSNATWVSGGVWYQIEGNSSLSSDQLIRMASSI